MAGSEGAEANLESTPTWVVAIVCLVFVLVSLAAERLIHYTGKVHTFSRDEKFRK